MIIVKEYSGRMWKYDTNKELYFNEYTNKWVKNPRYQKGKFKGKSIGKTVGESVGKNITLNTDSNDIIVEGFHTYNWGINYSSNIEVQERLNVFLTILVYKYRSYINRQLKNSVFSMDNEDIDKIYAYFERNELISLLGVKWKELIKFLSEENYIKLIPRQNKYYDMLYTFEVQNKLLDINPITIKTETLRVYNSLIIYYKKVEKQLGELKFMFDIMSKFNIDITEERFIEIIKNKYPSYVKEKISEHKKYLNEKDYMERNSHIFKNILFYNKLTKFERLYSFKVDKFSGRLHSIFTNIPSECRKYIKLNKEHINIEIDLRQSQVCCLSKLLLEEIGENNFTKDCNNNDMYLMFKDLNNLESRDISKKFLFNILFGSPYVLNKEGHKFITKEHKQFKKLYPGAAEYIIKEKLKPNKLEKQHSIIAQKLQKIEVDMFTEIWKELKDNKIKFVTIHDSVMVNEKDMDITYEIINRIISEKLKGVKYELRINKY